MPVQIHITGDTAGEAIKEFAALSAAFSGAVPAPAAPEVKAAPKSQTATMNRALNDRKPVKQPEEKPEPVKQPEPEPTADASSEPPEPTLEELRAKASEVAKVKGAEAVKGLLEQFELTNISSVPKEARGAFMVELVALLEA